MLSLGLLFELMLFHELFSSTGLIEYDADDTLFELLDPFAVTKPPLLFDDLKAILGKECSVMLFLVPFQTWEYEPYGSLYWIKSSLDFPSTIVEGLI